MHCAGAEIEYAEFLRKVEDERTKQTRLVWFHLTAFLSHAAMISKLVSPISSNPIAKARKNALREQLEIDEDSEVLPRSARDNIEHFDERIDGWVNSENQNILEIVIPNRESYKFLNVQNKRVRRVLIQEPLVFISEDRDGGQFELELVPLHAEIKRIKNMANQWIGQESPYYFLYPQNVQRGC
jgi:hypothetical protein